MAMKNSKSKLILLLVLTISCNFTLAYASPMPKEEITVLKNEIINLDSGNPVDDSLILEFQGLLEQIFLNRNLAILSKDSEGLKTFYDLNKKVGLWAYENEIKKIKYFSNWTEKQGTTFNKINSKLKVKKVREREPNLYGVITYVSTEFYYSYIDEPLIENRFKLGTYHYLNLKKEGDKYIITKEWYTDPLADSLNIESIKSDEIKNYILAHKYPDWTPDERTQNAINYAHTYCGVSDNEEFLFKYNKDYKNFNPEGGDCANFASQILHEGGKFKKNGTWNYVNGSGTKSWVNAQGFKNYMLNSGRASYIAKGSYQQTYKDAFQLRPGDFVAYEKKGRITHISTVTGLDSKGYPLVTCHNTDRLLVPYDLGWSNSNIKFHFVDVHY